MRARRQPPELLLGRRLRLAVERLPTMDSGANASPGRVSITPYGSKADGLGAHGGKRVCRREIRFCSPPPASTCPRELSAVARERAGVVAALEDGMPYSVMPPFHDEPEGTRPPGFA